MPIRRRALTGRMRSHGTAGPHGSVSPGSSGNRRDSMTIASSPPPNGLSPFGSAEDSPPAAPASTHFTGLVLDDDPELLQASYALRYQVYCRERQFLSP